MVEEVLGALSEEGVELLGPESAAAVRVALHKQSAICYLLLLVAMTHHAVQGVARIDRSTVLMVLWALLSDPQHRACLLGLGLE